jgi:multiple sugar transport system substrate-binding protein
MAIKSIKLWLGALAAAVAAIVLLPPPEEPKRLPHRKPVYFWHPWAGEWQPYLLDACKRFNQKQDKYEVIPLFVPNDGASTKFLMSAAGGATPDVLVQWDQVLGPWAEKGLIRPLDDLMTPEERGRYLREAYPVALKYTYYRGKIMGAVPGIDCYAVYYRLDHLKEIGRDENSLPKTLEELVEMGKKLDRWDKHGNLKRVGFLPQGLFAYSPVFGGSFQTDPEIRMNTPENRRALNFIVQQVKRLGKDNITRFSAAQPNDEGTNAPLLAGNVSMMLDGQWKVKQTDMDAPKGFRYVVGPVPKPSVGGLALASQTSSNFILIPTASKNPEGAWAFTKFWIGFDDPEEGARNSIDMGWLPYSHRVTYSKTYQAYVAKHPPFKTFLKLDESNHLQLPPVGPIQKFVTDEIIKASDSASNLTLTPEVALANLERNIKVEYDRQKRLGNVR